MAQSRLERIGTIYTRITSLLKGGALKEADKPLWVEIYEAFPPKYEPRFDRKTPLTPVKPIFYEEDFVRVKLHKDVHIVTNLRNFRISDTQKFFSIHNDLKKEGIQEPDLYTQALEKYKSERQKFTDKKNSQEQSESRNKQYLNIKEFFVKSE